MSHLISIQRALHAEMLKLKRTLAFRLVFAAPVPVVMLAAVVVWEKSSENPHFDMWDTLSKVAMGSWSIFILPLLITLETALLNHIDHSDKTWKHIFALPIPRSAVYLAKLAVSHMLIALSCALLVLLLVLSGLSLINLRDGLAASGAPPIGLMIKNGTMVWLSSGLIIAIHHWISIRWSAYTVSLGAGIAGTFFAIFSSGVRLGEYFPWLLPANALSPERSGSALWLGIVGGVVVAAAGCLFFISRDVMDAETRAFSFLKK